MLCSTAQRPRRLRSPCTSVYTCPALSTRDGEQWSETSRRRRQERASWPFGVATRQGWRTNVKPVAIITGWKFSFGATSVCFRTMVRKIASGALGGLGERPPAAGAAGFEYQRAVFRSPCRVKSRGRPGVPMPAPPRASVGGAEREEVINLLRIVHSTVKRRRGSCGRKRHSAAKRTPHRPPCIVRCLFTALPNYLSPAMEAVRLWIARCCALRGASRSEEQPRTRRRPWSPWRQMSLANLSRSSPGSSPEAQALAKSEALPGSRPPGRPGSCRTTPGPCAPRSSPPSRCSSR